MKRLALITLFGVVVAACSTRGHHEISDLEIPATPISWASWADVLASPASIRVTALVTGWVTAGPEILIDADDPRVPDELRRELRVPSIAFLVEHPNGSRILLDAGVRSGDCSYGLRPVYWVPCENSVGGDAISQLRERNLDVADIDYVIMSHFHGDHVSGLQRILEKASIPVVTTRDEIVAATRAFAFLGGYQSDMLATPMDVRVVDAHMKQMPIVGDAVDFFGDGSLWLISTPGHSPGHLSVFVNSNEPTLFTFDTSHLDFGFENGVPPGATWDKQQAELSLSRLRRFAESFPLIKVVTGHEPSKWPAS